jgi:hypothetical protein
MGKHYKWHERTFGSQLYADGTFSTSTVSNKSSAPGAIALIIFVSLFVSCHSAQKIQVDLPVASTLLIENDLEAQQKILLAFAKGYPDKISGVQFFNDDWTMFVNGKRFYYAHGRFLPEELRAQWEKYLPYDFYAYPWTGNDTQRKIFQENPVYSVGSSFLFDALYASPAEDDSWELQEKFNFLGVKMLVHPYIKSKLNLVLEQIKVAARADRTISEWISELQTGTPSFGWNWRVIAGTSRRSNHSYGTAIDLLPRDLKGRLTYWRWNEKETKKMNRQNYYMPPEKVIKIFEEYGFIWGGNWA